MGTVRVADETKPLSFAFEDGRPLADSKTGLRAQEASVGPVRGKAYVYATFEMGPVGHLARDQLGPVHAGLHSRVGG